MKFRASFTVLSQWASGNWDRAIKSYFKLEQFTTPAMAEGKKYHKAWAKETDEYKRLPLVFGGRELTDPICEQKVVVELAPWLDLVFIIDCIDKPVLFEYKTGKSTSEAYASSMQIPVYAVGATYAGHVIDRAEIHHYDQYKRQADMSQVWVTDKTLETGHNWLLTNAGEMHNYLLENRLYERFGGNLKARKNGNEN